MSSPIVDPDRKVWTSATVACYGMLACDKSCYRPLETVKLKAVARSADDAKCFFVVCDPERREYARVEAEVSEGLAEASFLARGIAGAHYVFLHWSDAKSHSRYVNFRVEPATYVKSGDTALDGLYEFTRERMLLGRRDYMTPRGRFVGYISADTWHFDGIWLRDWIHGFPAYRYWETCLKESVDRFFEVQSPDGMIPDGIERNGSTWRVGLESDVEYIAVMAVYYAWQASSDDAWLAAKMPQLEKALSYIRQDPKHWDKVHELVMRQHSCDTWDYDIDGASDHGDSRHVVATCDQSGYILAFNMMGRLYAALGDASKSASWLDYALAYRKRAAELLWDGVKFKHHQHLEDIDHGDFDESKQLAMGNTWAVTRGMADSSQARSIVSEYERRYRESGDAYPWWSLQPGYPNRLNYFKDEFRRDGGYANGGLMPWVGGELSLASFLCGRERYGLALLQQYIDHLARTGGAQVWYWHNGEPGMRTTNEVDYACWGMAQWTGALFEGLAGLVDAGSGFDSLKLSPRWADSGCDKVSASVHYAASGAYAAYRLKIDRHAKSISLKLAGAPKKVHLELLLPVGWAPKSLHCGAGALAFSLKTVGESSYLVADAAMPEASQLLELSVKA